MISYRTCIKIRAVLEFVHETLIVSNANQLIY